MSRSLASLSALSSRALDAGPRRSATARRLLVGASVAAVLAATGSAQAAPLVGACTDLGVALPHLTNVGSVGSSLGLPGLDTTLNGIVTGINQGVVTPLSDASLRVGVLDTSGHVVNLSGSGLCNLGVSSLGLDTDRGLSIGGGRLDGLGSVAGGGALARDLSAIAVGNGSATALGATNAVALGTAAQVNAASGLALGLRGRVDANDAVALGSDTLAQVRGGVALGSGALASRAGLGGATEAFTGTGVASTVGAISVGATGAERQIVNVAGGTQATDAVNLRQLSTVGNRLAGAIGGGAGFDAVTGLLSAPSFTIRGSLYVDVGGALGAIDNELTRTTDRIDTITRDVATLRLGGSGNGSGSGSTLVTQDTPSSPIRVGATTGGTSVDISGTAGNRRITGVADGIDPTDAVNRNQLDAALQGVDARFDDLPLRADNTSGAPVPVASGRDSYASGYGARATGAKTAAVGNGAQATGDGASAFGNAASAAGSDATAIGRSASAGGAGSTAIGANAVASQDNAVAIGAGATTTRANQVAVGASGSSYTFAGLGSAQSRAAQSGTTRFVTADASGNLATSDYGPSSIAAIQGQMGALGNQVAGLGQALARSNRESRQGIAASMAMTSASMPSAPGRTSWTVNSATFRGEWAGGVAIAHRLDAPLPIAVTAGFSYSEANRQGARVGLAGEF